MKIYVSATEFCSSNMSQTIKSDRICATFCGDKILSQRQRFSQKLTSTHEAICCRNMLLQLVTGPVYPCIHRVICRHDLLLQLVTQCVPTLIQKHGTCLIFYHRKLSSVYYNKILLSIIIFYIIFLTIDRLNEENSSIHIRIGKFWQHNYFFSELGYIP